MDHYDLIVIGAGPAGEKGAAQAAYFGKRVALIERSPHPGGAGINTGTVPSKTLRETALYFSGLGQHGLYGVDYQVKSHLTVKDFMYREQEVVRSLRQVVTENIVRHKIQLLRGHATFEDPHTLRVTRENEPDRLLTGDVILVATGSVPTRLKESVVSYSPETDGVRLQLKSGASLLVDQVLVAAGRVANVRTLGIDRAGLAVNERGLITVNESYQTSVPHIYAAGDVIGFPALASTSMEQARVAMVQAFDLPKYKTRVAPIFPLAVYTIPEISMAGETEETCKQKTIDYCIGRAFYRTNARGQISGDLGGEIKLVFRYPDKLLLGVHIIGVSAAELVHIGLIALQTECTIDMFVNTVFNYPSLSDVYKYAAYDGLGAVQRRAAAEAKS